MLKVTHNAGFFSCCTVRLQEIIAYFNKHTQLPIVDSSRQFVLYKPDNHVSDITQMFFEPSDISVTYAGPLSITPDGSEDQFSNYKNLNYHQIQPFVQRYFSLSSRVKAVVSELETKYALDYSRICVIYYRGLGKKIETNLASYHEFVGKARDVLKEKPDTIFLIQSDETEFVQMMCELFEHTIVFKEIHHVSNLTKVSNSEDVLPMNDRIRHAINFVAIVNIMSKARDVICYSGNCSLWIALFRGHARGFHQYLKPRETIYGIPNSAYNPNQTVFWV